MFIFAWVHPLSVMERSGQEAVAQSAELRAQGKPPALLFQVIKL